MLDVYFAITRLEDFGILDAHVKFEEKSLGNLFSVGSGELDLTHTLTPGQSFRWKCGCDGRWTAVVGHRVVRVWREGDDLRFELYPGGGEEDFIRDYFRLDVELSVLYDNFLRADGRIAESIDRFSGLRVVRQVPEETLLSYICSAANSVPRISRAVEVMSKRWGEKIAVVDGDDYYAFPSVHALANADVDEMARICGLGFRAANLRNVAVQILDRPEGWVDSLRQASYEEARRELTSINGVGLKIADCVLLFSMDKDQAVPVDTHIRQIAVKYYLPEFKQKTLTPGVYQRIAGFFQEKFGPFAGWAQEYLFYDDLLKRQTVERIL